MILMSIFIVESTLISRYPMKGARLELSKSEEEALMSDTGYKLGIL
jgi:hypothetical protein